jgi:hypothetical protein
MVPQLQFDRVRFQIVLAFQVGLIILADVVSEQRERHNQWKVSLIIMIYDFQQLVLFVECTIKVRRCRSDRKVSGREGR